jgi:two-component system NtrC family sensor kinase
MLESTLEILNNGLDNVMMLGEQKNVQAIIVRIAESVGVDHIRIFDANGIITQSSDSSDLGKSMFELAPDHLPEAFIKSNERVIRILDDKHAYAAFQPITNKPECQSCHGTEAIISYMDIDTHLTEAEVQFYTGTVHIIFLGVAVIIILSIGLFMLFNKYINIPLQIFSNALDQVETGDLSTRLDASKNDEFGKLNSHFNKMVEEIQAYRIRINEMHQQQLLHSDKLATIGEITSQMAHEINNYTGIALTRSDYLLLEAEKNNELSRFNNDIKVIQNEIERVSEITKSVLRHSKKRKILFEKINLADVLMQCKAMLDPVTKQKNIKLNTECNCNGEIIIGDPSLIEQLIINLINNSIDAINDDGEIIVTCGRQNGNVLLSIRDNGCGINSDEQEKIFSPFYTTKTDDKGTGLGLYIVKTICDKHNAVIDCNSTYGKGTEFKITFKSPEKDNG